MSDLQRVLDVMMRATLTELQLCSHVPAASLSSTGGHQKPGTVEPRGDVSPVVFAERFAKAQNNAERLAVVVACEAEVEALRKRPAVVVVGETEAERRARIVRETVSWSPEDVGTSTHDATATMIRRWRLDAGRDPQWGRPVAEMEVVRLAPVERKAEALRLAALGKGVRDIAELLGEQRMTIHRDLNTQKRAA